MKSVVFIIVILFSCSIELIAQKINLQVLSPAGNRYQTNLMSVDWTIGEVSISTIHGTSNLITQGFHQSHFIITPIVELKNDIGKISVYPNPATDLIRMNMTFDKVYTIQVHLRDINGKLLWNNTFTGQGISESLSLKDFPNSNYILHFLLEENRLTQTFKIQKIH